MATKFVQRDALGPSQYTGSHSGISVDSDDNLLKVNVDGTQRPYATAYVKNLTASATATPVDSGTMYIADSTTSVVVTLPSTAVGLQYTLVVGQLTSSGGHAFSPAAADKIMGGGTTAVDNKDIICSAASDRDGDAITVVADGIDGWYITSVSGTWAAES